MTAAVLLLAARAIATLRVLVFTLSLLPLRGDGELAYRLELSGAIAAVTFDAVEEDLLASIARFESNYERDVGECRRIGRYKDRTAFQIVARSDAELGALCVSLEGDARIALERVRESVTACRFLPPAERLAVYARGRCSSVEGRRLSRIRWPRSAR